MSLSGPTKKQWKIEIVSPSESCGKPGERVVFKYGQAMTPFGRCLPAASERGICFLGFVDTHQQIPEILAHLQTDRPASLLIENQICVKKLIEKIFRPPSPDGSETVSLDLKGTEFQIKVWQALLQIPPGHRLCYQELAKLIGQPQACRAVGRALAVNPVSYLIPCHRVISKSGRTHHYRWGSKRKEALIAHEAAALARAHLATHPKKA